MYNYIAGGFGLNWPNHDYSTEDSYCGTTTHLYTLCLERNWKFKTETFTSREAANNRMYELCRKYGLQIVKKYDDRHDKTYITSSGARFYINRI